MNNKLFPPIIFLLLTLFLAAPISLAMEEQLKDMEWISQLDEQHQKIIDAYNEIYAYNEKNEEVFYSLVQSSVFFVFVYHYQEYLKMALDFNSKRSFLMILNRRLSSDLTDQQRTMAIAGCYKYLSSKEFHSLAINKRATIKWAQSALKQFETMQPVNSDKNTYGVYYRDKNGDAQELTVDKEKIQRKINQLKEQITLNKTNEIDNFLETLSVEDTTIISTEEQNLLDLIITHKRTEILNLFLKKRFHVGDKIIINNFYRLIKLGVEAGDIKLVNAVLKKHGDIWSEFNSFKFWTIDEAFLEINSYATDNKEKLVDINDANKKQEDLQNLLDLLTDSLKEHNVTSNYQSQNGLLVLSFPEADMANKIADIFKSGMYTFSVIKDKQKLSITIPIIYRLDVAFWKKIKEYILQGISDYLKPKKSTQTSTTYNDVDLLTYDTKDITTNKPSEERPKKVKPTSGYKDDTKKIIKKKINPVPKPPKNSRQTQKDKNSIVTKTIEVKEKMSKQSAIKKEPLPQPYPFVPANAEQSIELTSYPVRFGINTSDQEIIAKEKIDYSFVNLLAIYNNILQESVTKKDKELRDTLAHGILALNFVQLFDSNKEVYLSTTINNLLSMENIIIHERNILYNNFKNAVKYYDDKNDKKQSNERLMQCQALALLVKLYSKDLSNNSDAVVGLLFVLGEHFMWLNEMSLSIINDIDLISALKNFRASFMVNIENKKTKQLVMSAQVIFDMLLNHWREEAKNQG